MKIDHLILGSYETNCYILRGGEAGTDCLIIDTGLSAEPLLDFLLGHKLKPLAVVLTHGHTDHIAGIDLLRKSFPEIKVCIHRCDAEAMTCTDRNLSALAGAHFSTKPAEVLLEEGDFVEYAGIKLKVFHTPGHTPGGICLYSEDESLVFVGDSLFAGSVGRTDFPFSNHEQLIAAIKEKLLSLPDQTVVYPGHGPVTTIGTERGRNPFLRL